MLLVPHGNEKKNCSHAHALFQDRFKDVQAGSRWFSTLYILSPNFHKPANAEIAEDKLLQAALDSVGHVLEHLG